MLSWIADSAPPRPVLRDPADARLGVLLKKPLGEAELASSVVGELATAVWSFFEATPKRLTDPYEREGYEAFCEEYARTRSCSVATDRTCGSTGRC